MINVLLVNRYFIGLLLMINAERGDYFRCVNSEIGGGRRGRVIVVTV